MRSHQLDDCGDISLRCKALSWSTRHRNHPAAFPNRNRIDAHGNGSSSDSDDRACR